MSNLKLGRGILKLKYSSNLFERHVCCLYTQQLSIKPFTENLRKREETMEEDYKKFMINPEGNLKNIMKKIESMTLILKSTNSQVAIRNVHDALEDILRVPVMLPLDNPIFSSFGQTLSNSYQKLVIDSEKDLFLLLQILDLIELNGVSIQLIDFILGPDNHKFVNEQSNPEFISFILYFISKTQYENCQDIVNLIVSLINNDSFKFTADQASKTLVAMSVLKASSNQNLGISQNVFSKIISHFERKISDLGYLDAFRICMAISKKTVDSSLISQRLWNEIQKSAVTNINKYSLYMISNILVCLCEYSFVDSHTFNKIQREVVESYINKIPEISKINKQINGNDEKQDFDYQGFIDDLSLICFSFGLNKAGSGNYWSKILEFVRAKKKFISEPALENFFFCAYRIVDSPAIAEGNLADELNELLKMLSDLLEERELLSKNVVNPFNVMMPLCRFNFFNTKIWNDLTKNVMDALSNPKFSANSYVLSDIAYAFGTYNSFLIQQQSSNSKDSFPNDYYSLNKEKFWKTVEAQFLNCTGFSSASLSNIALDLTQVDLKLEGIWSVVTSKVLEGFRSNDPELKFDNYSYCLVLLAYSRLGLDNIPNEVHFELSNYFMKNSENFSLDELKKISMCFMRSTKEYNIWAKYEEVFLSQLSKIKDPNLITYDFVADLQIPFAIVGIKNPLIWKKFAEVALRNINRLNDDLEFLMNALFAFSKAQCVSSEIFWNKIFELVSKNIQSFEIEDLCHVAVCLDEKLFLWDQKLHKIIFESKDAKIFWNKLAAEIYKKIDNPGLSIPVLNSLSRVITENNSMKTLALTFKGVSSTVSLKDKVDMKLQVASQKMK